MDNTLFTIADIASVTNGNPTIAGIFSEKVNAYPELRDVPAMTISTKGYKTLWDADTDVGQVNYDASGHFGFDFSKLGGFRQINGYAPKVGQPEWELRNVNTVIMERNVRMDSLLPQELDLTQAERGALIMRYEDRVLGRELQRIADTHAFGFWYGTKVDAESYQGVYQTCQLGYTTSALDDWNNSGSEGDAGNHASVWLIKNDMNDEDGLHWVFSGSSLGELRWENWKEDIVTDPNDSTKSRVDLYNNIIHRPGLANLSKWNAIRIYGITNTSGANAITDDMGYEIKSMLPTGLDLSRYTAWMNPQVHYWLRKSRDKTTNRQSSVVLSPDGKPIVMPDDWAGFPIKLTDRLSVKEP